MDRKKFWGLVGLYHTFFVAKTAVFDGRSSKHFEDVFNKTWHVDLCRVKFYHLIFIVLNTLIAVIGAHNLSHTVGDTASPCCSQRLAK